MNVAIIHFHLNRGGVTQVILGHLRSLNTRQEGRPERVALLYGGRAADWPENLPEELDAIEVSLHTVDGLDYDPHDAKPQSEPLADSLHQTLRNLGFRPDETVLHVHNHNLGKNVSLPGAVRQLAVEGYGVLYQIHDFAEDFRPENYRHMVSSLCPGEPAELPRHLYPDAEQIHYAVLNGRDRNVLATAGVPDSRLHMLPNPVSDFALNADKGEVRAKYRELFGLAPDSRLAIYPVRGIRRKNLGEALLWSALGNEDLHVGFTLAPLNPVERIRYDAWRGLAEDLSLPCLFELGHCDALTFDENLVAADYILTTSIAEGFGLVFLEAWLTGRDLIGRNLPEITSDFVTQGIRFPHLTDRLNIPIDWIGEASVRDQLASLYRRVLDSYGLTPMADAEIQMSLNQAVVDGSVDFALLGSRDQERIIRRIHASAQDRRTLLQWNPAIAAVLNSETATEEATIEANARLVRESYSHTVTAKRLTDIYRQIGAAGCSDTIVGIPHGQRILDRFITPARLHPIRLES